jgi:hypothetical protein
MHDQTLTIHRTETTIAPNHRFSCVFTQYSTNKTRFIKKYLTRWHHVERYAAPMPYCFY